jgi:hypothetical protein
MNHFNELFFTFFYSLEYLVSRHVCSLTVIILFLTSRFDVKIASAVAEETNLPFVPAENKFEALVGF